MRGSYAKILLFMIIKIKTTDRYKGREKVGNEEGNGKTQ